MSARSLAAALGLLALCVGSHASAWEGYRGSDGQLRRWSSFPLTLRLLPPGAGALAPQGWELAARNAIETWQSVDSAAVAVRVGPSAPAGARPAAGEVLLSFDNAAFPASRDAAGITDLVTDAPGGDVITSAHVHLNGRDFNWATDGSAGALDFQSVALHELGHALGLAHPCGDADTGTPSCETLAPAARAALSADVMYPSISPGPKRALAADDVAGISALQPASSAQPAPSLESASPACAPDLAGLKLSLFASRSVGADTLIVASNGVSLAEVPAARDSSGVLSARLPGSLHAPAGVTAVDLLLVASTTKKAAALPAGLAIGNCKAGGCDASGGAGGGALLCALPLLFALRRRRGLAAIGALGLALVTAAPAQAFVRSTAGQGGPCLFWSTRGHAYQIDAKGTPDVPGSTAFDAVDKSFAAWAGIACSDLVFPNLGLSKEPNDRRIGYVSGAFNRNLVLWRTANCSQGGAPPNDPCQTAGGCGNTYDCWDHGDSVIAVTTTTFNRTTGEIYDADIELNDALHSDGSKFQFTTVDSGPTCSSNGQSNCVAYDIENTVTHEAGHSIGLGHSADQTATMFAFAPEGDTSKRALHPDDTAAICVMYPKGARTATCLGDPVTLVSGASSDGGGCGCSPRSNASALWVAATGMALLALRRRGQKRPRA